MAFRLHGLTHHRRGQNRIVCFQSTGPGAPGIALGASPERRWPVLENFQEVTALLLIPLLFGLSLQAIWRIGRGCPCRTCTWRLITPGASMVWGGPPVRKTPEMRCRQKANFDPELRDLTRSTAGRLRELIASGGTPAAVSPNAPRPYP